jgi:cytochrome c553
MILASSVRSSARSNRAGSPIIQMVTRLAVVWTLAIGWPVPSLAQASASSIDVPAWLFPFQAPATKPDSVTLQRVPGSQVTFTAAAAGNPYSVVDWFPASHAPMPEIVSHGRQRAVWACAYCHLPDGSGRPENAMLAGLPVAYIEEQVTDIKSGARHGPWPLPFAPSDNMRKVADSATADEIAAAARYFSGLRSRQRSRVVEATDIPRPVAGAGIWVSEANSEKEPLGHRLIEMPADAHRHELRDPLVEYLAYVPRGSIARGRVLATVGAPPATPPCESCHGPGLRGVALVPPLAGRSPSYVLRQLLAFRNGTRSAAASAPMRAVVQTLSLDDMIAAAAYAASRTP